MNEELIRKYRLAGKIRFMSFSLLLLFLLLMKSVGGYSYLNTAFIALILVEAVLNQPYNFIVRRVNIHRFQYYQMITDIIVISWVMHYMGGIEAPLVSMAYYAVILWAGVASTTQAVFFATAASALFFSLIVIFGHFGILPFVSYYSHKIPAEQMFSLVSGNVAFLFAFGYFSAQSSRVIQFLQRKKQEESLRSAHKLIATGHLVGNVVHDVLNDLFSIRGYTTLLLDKNDRDAGEKEILKSIDRLGGKSTELLDKLARFSRKRVYEFEPTDICKVIDSALELTRPLVRYSGMTVRKVLEAGIPLVSGDQNRLQEVFVVLILNALDAVAEKKGALIIKARYGRENNNIRIAFADTGVGIKKEDLKRIGEPFFTTKKSEEGAGLGLATAYGIVAKHNGKIEAESMVGKGTTFIVQLPVAEVS